MLRVFNAGLFFCGLGLYVIYSSPCGPLSPLDGTSFQPRRFLIQRKCGYIPILVVHSPAHMGFIPAPVVLFPP